MDKENTKKNWKNIYILGIASFFNDFSSEMIYPLIPIFIKSVLGVGANFIGIIEGIAETTNSLFKLFSGYFSDKFKKRKIFVVFGYAFSNIVRPLRHSQFMGIFACAALFGQDRKRSKDLAKGCNNR